MNWRDMIKNFWLPAALLMALTAMASPPRLLAAVDSNAYQSAKYGFSIVPPSDWLVKNSGASLVMFTDKNYQAFILIDLVIAPDPVSIDSDFKSFIDQKNEEVKKRVPSFKVIANRPGNISHFSCYVTDATYQSGPNTTIMSIYYVPIGKKIFMISAICPQDEAEGWKDVFRRTLSTFSVTS